MDDTGITNIMKAEKNITKFAPIERASKTTLERQIESLKKVPFLDLFCNSVSEIVMIFNKERQIVFYNKNLVDFFKIKSDVSIYGMRFGELIGCVNATKAPYQCGASEFCRVCGAVNAIINSMSGDKTDVREMRIMRGKNEEALDLLVKASPFKIDNERFTIFSASDTSSEKRKKVLERIFFHDILNTITGMQLNIELLDTGSLKNVYRARKTLMQSIKELIVEINEQKILTAAENSELEIKPCKVRAKELMAELKDYYSPLARQKKVNLKLVKFDKNILFATDKAILTRVLSNMIKNAIEASDSGQEVTLSGGISADKIIFNVHNSAVLNRDIQLQLFQRSFSTKGEDRGLGTYSMKLLSERYLNGKVDFVSEKAKGTIFTASYPVEWRKA